MKKILSIMVLLLCLVSLAGCLDVSDIKSLEFSKAPEGSYNVGQPVRAKDFEVKASLTDGTYVYLDLLSNELTVQGLDGEKLDTRTPGAKVLKVTYRGLTITFNYVVDDKQEATGLWTKFATQAPKLEGDVYQITKAEDLAWFATETGKATKVIKAVLTTDIDLSAHLWVPVNAETFELDGQNYSIKNLKPAAPSAIIANLELGASGNLGLCGDVTKSLIVKNVTIENAVMNFREYKNYGALAGHTGGTVTVDNVTVTGLSISSMGRAGGLVGQAGNGVISISNTYVEGAIYGYNPVSVAVADGEGDKFGGLIGQITGNAKTIAVEGCQVKVDINGTRDLGGFFGYAGGGTYTFKANKVLSGSILSASVAGGMLKEKSTRNVGGMIGTVAKEGSLLVSVSIDANPVEEGVVILLNNLYEDSSKSLFIGGYRYGTGLDLSVTVGTKEPVKLEGPAKNLGYTEHGFDAEFKQYQAKQAAMVAAIEALFA